MDQATEIPLQYWLDPQGDSVVIYSSRECLVFRGCWVAPGEPADFIACLSFNDVGGVRCFPREFSPYHPRQSSNGSSIWYLADSEMIREYLAYRHRHYPNGKVDGSKLCHYVIEGHDYCHDILARGFTESAIPAGDIVDDRLKRLLLEA